MYSLGMAPLANYIFLNWLLLIHLNDFETLFFKSIFISRKKIMSKLSIEQTKTKAEFKNIFTLVDISVMNIDTIYKIK